MNRTRWASLLTALVAVALAATAAAGEAKVNAKPGNWSVTMTVDMPNLPMQMPAYTVEQCLTEKDLVPQQPGETCKSPNPKITGNTVEWTIDCQGKDGSAIKGSGKATYAGETFEGSMDVTAMGLPMKYKLSGKRLGECAKKEPVKPAK